MSDPRPDSAAPWLVDLVLAGAMSLAVAVVIAADVTGAGRAGIGAYGFAVGFGALILLRRRAPRVMLVMTVLGIFSYYALGFAPIGMALPAAAALFSAAEQSRTGWAIGAGVALVSVSTFFRISDPASAILTPYDLVTNVALVGAAIALGVAVRLTRETRDQAARLRALTEAEQAHAMQSRLQQERARIARDLHDQLGHELSVMSLHAGVASEALGRDDAAAQTALARVRAAASGALDELRATVKVLRSEDGPGSRRPSPGIADIEQLADTARAAGIEVVVELPGPDTGLSTTVSTTIYQIVQEALTNVIRHADADHVEVQVSTAGERLVVRVTDDGAGSARTVASVSTGSAADTGIMGNGFMGTGIMGTGIIGMRERAALLGGTLTAGPLPRAGFEVRAEFRLEAP